MSAAVLATIGRTSLLAAVAISVAGCGDPRRDEQIEGAGTALGDTTDEPAPGDTTTAPAGGGSGASGADTTGNGGDADAEGTSDFKFDVPNDTAGVGPLGACEKVDFLFAIDNSGSMGGRQIALANSFPGFIDAIGASVAAQDYQILVTDSDAVAVMGSLASGCGASGSCDDICATCDHAAGTVCVCTCDDPAVECVDASASCQNTHGAGQVLDQSGNDCGVVGDQRFITAGQPDLKETFQCLALVGDYGMALERPVTAAIKAITTETQDGGCNAGFLRDDALLVVTLITDDPHGVVAASQYEDAGYLADAEGWFDAFVDAKGGVADNVVMLGVLDPGSGSPVFVDLVDRFGDRGLIGDITEDDYSGFFEQAVGLIDTACDEFEPAG